MKYKFYYTAFSIAFLFFWSCAQFFIFMNEQPQSSGYTASLILSGILSALVMFFPTRHWGPLSPTFILGALTLFFFPIFSMIYMAFPELGKWYHQYFSMQFFQRNLAVVSFNYTVALVLFLVGYVFGETVSKPAPVAHDAKPVAFGRTVTFLCVLVGLVGMVLYAMSLGGFGAVLEQMSNMETRRNWRDSGSGLAYYAGMLLMTAGPVYFLLAFVSRQKFSALLMPSMLLMFSAAVLVVSQASREKSIFPIILTVFALVCLVRGTKLSALRANVRFITLFMIALVVIFFSLQTVFRWSQEGFTEEASLLRKLSDFNRIDVSIVIFVEYFSDINSGEVLYGMPIFAYVNQIFVRLFDAAPVLNTSALLHDLIFNGDNKAGYPGTPIVGELYMNFGYMGFLFLLPFGAFFGSTYNKMISSDYELWRCIFYAAHIYFFMIKMCIYIGLSESLLLMALVYFPLFFFKFLSTRRIVTS